MPGPHLRWFLRLTFAQRAIRSDKAAFFPEHPSAGIFASAQCSATTQGLERKLEDESTRNLVEDARRFLGECGLFRGLGPDERKLLLARVGVRSFSPGETIFTRGSPGGNMMAVLRGSVRIGVNSAEGRGIVLAILQPGEVFGEIALLDGKDRTADATAMTACSLAVLNRRDILGFLERYPAGWSYIVGVLCDRLRRTDEQLAEVALLQIPVRLAKVLLRMMEDDPHAELESKVYRMRLLQRELGELIGVTRESVNKCLHTWQRNGILVIEKGQITVTNRSALEELVEGV
jgi:CRP/FNR family transcriptional regulator, cyclic AMP receptor protein